MAEMTPMMPTHRYLKKMAAMAERGELPRVPGVHMVAVYHDGDCDIFADALCTCDADIVVEWSLPAGSEN